MVKFTEAEVQELLETLPEAEVILNELLKSDFVKIVESDEDITKD